MKYLILSSMLVLAAACSPAADDGAAKKADATAPAAASAADLSAAEAEVKQFIETYNGYYSANDMDRYFASFDPSLTQLWSSGRVTLQEYETDWRKGVAAGGGNTKVDVSDLVVQVSPSGDAAVASYFLTVLGRTDGKPDAKPGQYQETDVLFKKDGQWKIVHVNYRNKPEPRQRPAAAAAPAAAAPAN
jgi:ketosteroid isomerase-like protein